jgi:hypothetical protein
MPKLAEHHFRFDSASLKPDQKTYRHGIVQAVVVEYVCQRCGKRTKVKYDQAQTYGQGRCPKIWRDSN